ncbi:MAG: type 4a pilus biogenesis protein PilO [Alicyclobacillaceae bacterium]|nr:type 4a pilus biogenesis protein PilO [Alicyclobacillaceae bacterium]
MTVGAGKWLAPIAVAGILVALYVFGWQHPWKDKYAAAQARLQVMEGASRSPERLAASRAAVLAKIPAWEDGVRLHESLLDAAGKAGVAITRIQMGGSYGLQGGDPAVFRMPVSVEWTGTWDAGVQFVAGLSELPRAVTNVQFQISTSSLTGQGGQGPLGPASAPEGTAYAGKVEFDALWYRKGASVPVTNPGRSADAAKSAP